MLAGSESMCIFNFDGYSISSFMEAYHFTPLLVKHKECLFMGFSGGSSVKNLPTIRDTWVRSLGWEEPLEEGMATHSSVLAWKILMDRGAWQATVHGVAKSDRTELLSTA